MILKKYDLYVLGLICFLFLAVTNTYFNYDESLIFGALDGKDYFLISKNFPNFPNDDELSFIKLNFRNCRRIVNKYENFFTIGYVFF